MPLPHQTTRKILAAAATACRAYTTSACETEAGLFSLPTCCAGTQGPAPRPRQSPLPAAWGTPVKRAGGGEIICVRACVCDKQACGSKVPSQQTAPVLPPSPPTTPHHRAGTPPLDFPWHPPTHLWPPEGVRQRAPSHQLCDQDVGLLLGAGPQELQKRYVWVCVWGAGGRTTSATRM